MNSALGSPTFAPEREERELFLPRVIIRHESHPLPRRLAGAFEIAGKVRQLLDLGWHDGRLRHVPMTHAVGDLRAVTAGEERGAAARMLNFGPHNLPLANELRGESGSSPVLRGGAAQDERIAAVLDESLGITAPIGV